MAEVKITLTTEDKNSAQVFKGLQDNGKSAFDGIQNEARNAAAGASSAFDGILSHWKGLVAGIASYKAISAFGDLIKDSTLLAARVETLDIVMQTVGRNMGYSSDQMRGFAEGVASMGITTRESEQSVVRLAQAHLDLTKASQLARVAQDAAVIGDVNSSEAMNRLIHGITTLQPEILRTIGITVNFEQEYAKFANTTGVATDAISQQQKQQIALSAVLREGQAIAGTYEAAMGTIGKQMSSMPRLIEEAKLGFGELFKPIWGEIMGEIYEKLKNFNEKIKEMKEDGSLAEWGVTAVPVIKSLATELAILAGVLTTIAGINAAKSLASLAGLTTGIGGFLAVGTASALAGAELGYWSTGQYDALKRYNLQLKGSNDWIKEQTEFMKDLKAIRDKHNDSLDKELIATREAKNEFTKWSQAIELTNPDVTELDKQVMKLWNDAQKFKTEGIPKGQVEESLNKGLDFAYTSQLKGFNDLMLSMSTARKEGIVKDLAEIDKTQTDAIKKYSSNEQNREAMVTAIAQGEDLKRIDSLKKWKDSLISMHNEAIAKAREYYKTVDDLNMALNKSAGFMDQWQKGFPTDKKSVFENEQQNLKLLIDQATNNPIAANLQSAMSGIEGLMQKNNQLRTEMVDTPGKGLQPIFSDSDASKYYDLYSWMQTALAGVRDAAKSAGDAEMSTAMKLAEMIKPVDTAMDLLKTKFTDYVDLISVQRQVTLDTNPAVDSIQAIITKTTEALGYIQQLNRYNTSSTSVMSGLAPSVPIATVAPAENAPVLAGGTPYVRKGGYAWVDPGERVMTADQNKSYGGGSGGKQVTINPTITMNVNGVTDPNELARQVLKPLNQLLREYNHLIGGN
jgi:hypothetical protein